LIDSGRHDEVRRHAADTANQQMPGAVSRIFRRCPTNSNGIDMSYNQTVTLGGLFDIGLSARREVLGAEYVDKSMESANDFMMAFQHITTEWCWGYAWNRPGLDRKTRSIVNLAMLTALNKPAELRLHVKGAITNGVTVDEIKEILLHATVYCGIPSGLEAFKTANAVLVEMGKIK
jgi:4-carboxymuconolactone decarboxylase